MSNNKILAILWSIILIVSIVACATGAPCEWFEVFCPLTVLTLKYWLED